MIQNINVLICQFDDNQIERNTITFSVNIAIWMMKQTDTVKHKDKDTYLNILRIMSVTLSANNNIV